MRLGVYRVIRDTRSCTQVTCREEMTNMLQGTRRRISGDRSWATWFALAGGLALGLALWLVPNLALPGSVPRRPDRRLTRSP